MNRKTQFSILFLAMLFALASCASMLPKGFSLDMLTTSEGSSESTSETTTEELINGRSIEEEEDEDEEEDRPRKRRKRRKRHADYDEDEYEDDDDEDYDEPRRKRGKRKKLAKKGGDIGSTCQKNNECEHRACFVGYGNLGYCTKMCDSWSDCPSFWKCKRAGNAPQKICMQDK